MSAENIRTHYHVSLAPMPLSSTEKEVIESLHRWYREHSLRPPRWAPGLQQAAQRLAQQLALGQTRSLRHSVVEAALWLGGCSDHQIRIFAMAFQRTKNLQSPLRTALASRLAGHRSNVWGMAVAKRRVQMVVMLFAKQGVQLSPVSRLWRWGQQVELQGRLHPHFSRPQVVVGLPYGKVIRPAVTMKTNRTFTAQWPVRWSGAMQVQVLVEDDKGPWISSQFELWGWGPPDQPQHVLQRKLAQYHQKIHGFGKEPTLPHAATSSRWTPQQAAHALWHIVNQHRKKRGLSWLQRHPTLDALAQSHANDMVKEHFFAHTSPQRGSFATRFGRLQWQQVALSRENIVVAFSPTQAFQFLHQSPSHRSNLLEPTFQWTGLGAAIDNKGAIFFVQVFVALHRG